MASIVDELKDLYKNGGMLIRLIFINVAVFVLFRVIHLVFFLGGSPESDPFSFWLSMPSDPAGLFTRPWTLITYMFYHEGLMHILFNMLNLYWFGKIFLMYFDEKKLLTLYLLGGIAGGLFYFLIYNLFPSTFGPAILMGASASIVAVLIAVSFYVPNFKVFMFFVGEVKLLYIGLFSVLLFVILIASDNSGGNLAHLGGAMIGYIWVAQFKKGKDIMRGFGRFLDAFFKLFKPRNKLKVTHKRPVTDMEYNAQKADYQKEIDRILDKIAKNGYESLTAAEKETLFKMSNKN